MIELNIVIWFNNIFANTTTLYDIWHLISNLFIFILFMILLFILLKPSLSLKPAKSIIDQTNITKPNQYKLDINYFTKHIISISLIIGLGLIIKYIISIFWFRIRPEILLGLSTNIWQNSSFFSIHTFVAFVFALTIIKLLTKNKEIKTNPKYLGIIVIGLAIMVGLSRIVLARHYPTDVLASILFAIIMYFVINLLHKLIYKKYLN